MLTLSKPNAEPLSGEAVRLAGESGLTLEHLIGKEKQPFLNAAHRVSVERPDGTRAELSVPGAILPLLASLLKELGHGKEVVVVATDTELTTQQAANILNVSRPYFVKVLTDGKIPFRSVGSRRRVLLEDLIRYKEHETSARHQGLDELTAEAERLGMY
jgi:excisionase family DNA binding protein